MRRLLTALLPGLLSGLLCLPVAGFLRAAEDHHHDDHDEHDDHDNLGDHDDHDEHDHEPAGGELIDKDADLAKLTALVNELLVKDRQREKKLRAMQAKFARMQAQRNQPGLPEDTALDRALAHAAHEHAGHAHRGSVDTHGAVGTPPTRRFQLLDISANLLMSVGSSSADEDTLQTLQGGGHDPKKRGFTLQQLELSFSGAIDPYLRGEAHVVYAIDALSGESIVELEEAFAQTTNLPAGMQLEAGHFFTEFGRHNPLHPHDWTWQDQPIAHTRIFGPDGMRGPGARLGWRLPTPGDWFSQIHLGAQNANGETMFSFLGEQSGGGHGHGHEEEEEGDEHGFEEGIGGRPLVERRVKSFRDLVYLARWENGTPIGDEVEVLLGLSTLFGPNASGPDGRTWVGGADFTLKWRPPENNRGYPFLTWQNEFVWRHFKADRFGFLDEEEDPPERVALGPGGLDDWGFYSQVMWGFKRDWAVGVRFEYAAGRGANVEFEEEDGVEPGFVRVSRADDPLRNARLRVSPLLQWQPSEFTRVRVQYNYDQADHIRGEDAHSVWLGLDFTLGAHHHEHE